MKSIAQICTVHNAFWKATEVIVKAMPAREALSEKSGGVADDNAIERLLLLEIDALSRLRHPRIAGFLGACFDDPAGRILLVRELPAGGTLAAILAAGRAAVVGGRDRRAGVWAPPRRQAVGWALQLAQALNYMHQCEPLVAHGDLGPACLLLSGSGQLKVHLALCAFAVNTYTAPYAPCCILSLPQPFHVCKFCSSL